MLLSNPTADPGQFALKEFDGITINDDLREFDGEMIGSDYVYTMTTKYSDFWNAASSDTSDNIYEFYFEVDGVESEQLIIEVINGAVPTCSDGDINGAEEGVDCGGECPDTCPVSICETVKLCKEYDNAGDCNADAVVCDSATAIKSVGTLTGDQSAICYWDGECKARKTTPGVGDCVYTEDYGVDACDEDGFLSYSYEADFIWSPNNKYSATVLIDGKLIISNPDYISDGTYLHYDPDGESLNCQDGERTVQCPAQIQLSYFTWLNLVAAAILIIIAYLILANKKKKVSKKKSSINVIVKNNIKNVSKSKVVKKTTKKVAAKKKPVAKKKVATKKKK